MKPTKQNWVKPCAKDDKKDKKTSARDRKRAERLRYKQAGLVPVTVYVKPEYKNIITALGKKYK